jgi:hypothetical protein
MPAWSFAAQAAEPASQPAAGFADLVAKVKPAVISVRVKLDEPQSTVEDEEDQGEADASLTVLAESEVNRDARCSIAHPSLS